VAASVAAAADHAAAVAVGARQLLLVVGIGLYRWQAQQFAMRWSLEGVLLRLLLLLLLLLVLQLQRCRTPQPCFFLRRRHWRLLLEKGLPTCLG
jgi:hypothetical protein